MAEMTDSLTVLDPVTHWWWAVGVPSEALPPVQGGNASPTRSPHYGDDVWDETHNAEASQGRCPRRRSGRGVGTTRAIPGEGGPGVLPKAVKFQVRPDPLAK